jgi:alpha-L-fucosidase
MKNKLLWSMALLGVCLLGQAQSAEVDLVNKNKPEREEWLKDAGFGMFIHWNIDAQLGTVISHSLVGSSEAYAEKYINELPATFNPVDWNPEKIAILARNAGMKYLVFTTKHHNGFCVWDTESTDFNIMNTPYKKDILAGLVEACRRHGLAVGFYFSTEDFVFSYQQGVKDIKRTDHWEHTRSIREVYESYLQLQINELMTDYGAVDLLFIDSEAYREEVKEMVWEMQPNCIITRGAIPTPEQFIPGETIDVTWESCMTMGTQWNYKPTNEHYKTGTYLINALIEARARGGAYLLNVGPGPWGDLNEAQQGRLMELAAWNFINGEAVQDVRPWIVSNEGDIWFTKHKADQTVYAYITGIHDWKRGERKNFLLHSIQATGQTQISVLGQSGRVVEYQPQVDGSAKFEQTDKGLQISVVRAQRVYNNHQWPNPIVVKLEQVEAALVPAKFATLGAEVLGERKVKFSAEIKDSGQGESYELCFDFRPRVSSLDKGTVPDWKRSGSIPIRGAGNFSIEVGDELFQGMVRKEAEAGGMVNASSAQSGIEYRAVVIQDGLEIQGNKMNLD